MSLKLQQDNESATQHRKVLFERAALRQRWRAACRSAVVTAVVTAVLLGTVGFPVAPAPFKDRSRPFPCQDSHCGCPDADTCWQSCLCLTASQKMAWAQANGIDVPETVRLAARIERLAFDEPRCGVCVNCSTSNEMNSTESSETVNEPGVGAPGNEPVELAFSPFRRCGGLPLLWTVLSASLAADVQQFPIPVAVAGDWVRSVSDRCSIVIIEMDDPPPRHVAQV